LHFVRKLKIKNSSALNLSKLLILAILFNLSHSLLAEEMEAIDDLEFSLDDLMQVEVLSNTKFTQELNEIPAAVYIITKQDIKMSGASNLPDLLQQVPGLFVAPASSNTFAIGARGFAGVFANKLLVMVDGRSLFSPLFSGVFWEMQDIYLPDIKRIEVIRGSGSSTWGANAINGIINIITESAADTQTNQGYVKAGGNTKHDVGLRHGVELDDQAFGRVYLKRKEFDSFDVPADGVYDSWRSTAFGGKFDWFSGSDSWTLSADYVDQKSSDIMILPIGSTEPVNVTDNVSWNISGAWQQIVDADNQFSLGIHIQEQERDGFSYQAIDQMLNLEFDQTLNFNEKWQANYGLSARKHSIDVGADEVFSFAQDKLDVSAYVYSGYLLLHYDIDNNQALELGTKLENHQHDLVTISGTSNFDETYWLPNLRYVNKLADNMSFWLSVNHSSRVPSIAEHNMDVQLSGIPAFTELNPSPWLVEATFVANPQLKAEKATSFEIGFRSHVNSKLNLDIAVFATEFDDIRATTDDGQICKSNQQPVRNCPLQDSIVLRMLGTNGISADSHGLEIYGDWALNKDISAKFSYSYLDMDFQTKDSGIVVGATGLIYYRHQFSFLGYWQIDESNTFKLSLKHITDLQQFSDNEQLIEPEINRMDLLYRYEFNPNYTLNLEAINVFNDGKRQWFAESPTGHASLSQQEFRIGLEVLF